MTTRKKNQEELIELPRGQYELRHVSDGSLSGSVSTQSYAERSNYAKIAYEVGSARDRSKNCRHVLLETEVDPITGSRYYDSLHDLCHHGSRSLFWEADGGTFSSLVPSDAAIDGFNAEAFSAMSPSFETDLQMTNSLLELVELKQILKLGQRWGKFARYARKRLKLLKRNGARRAIMQTAQTIAEGHLTWAFGIKPFISDCEKLYEVFTQWSSSINDFLARRNVEQVRHYTKTLEDDSGEVDYEVSHTRCVTEFNRSCKLYATMRYTYDCGDLQSLADQANILRDKLGLRFGLAELWEAIPFSFVVDWFLRVGDFLERNRDPLVKIDLTVTDYCISYKCEMSKTGFSQLLGGRLTPHAFQRVGKVYQKQYVRKRTLPSSGSTFINSGHYGQNQLALSASLLTLLSTNRRS